MLVSSVSRRVILTVQPLVPLGGAVRRFFFVDGALGALSNPDGTMGALQVVFVGAFRVVLIRSLSLICFHHAGCSIPN